MHVYVFLAGVIDIEGEKGRLGKEIGKVEKELAVVAKKLANPDFLAKAAEAVVKKEQGEGPGARGEENRPGCGLDEPRRMYNCAAFRSRNFDPAAKDETRWIGGRGKDHVAASRVGRIDPDGPSLRTSGRGTSPPGRRSGG